MEFEVELTRTNVTPAQFLAYVRYTVDKKGGQMLRSDLDLDYFRKGDDLNFDTTHDGMREKSVSKPYQMQTFIKHDDGTRYNEICEFEFNTDGKTGTGYYYLLNEEPAQNATESEIANTVTQQPTEAENATEDTRTAQNAAEAEKTAQDWQQESDRVEAATLAALAPVIATEEAAPAAEETHQEKTDRETWEHCKRIAEELEAYAAGNVYKCPYCGQVYTMSDYEETEHENADGETAYTCPGCEWEILDCDLESLNLYDFFTDCLDIEYRCGSDREYRSVCIMVACGGPNIYIDTDSKAVELYWWTDRARFYLSSEAVEAVDDWAREYWECM